MYRGGFNWKTWKNPVGVRNYLKEIIMSIIEVHAEVSCLGAFGCHQSMFPSLTP